MKFCVGCKYYEEWEKERWTTDRHRCNREFTANPEYDLVTGRRVDKIDNCRNNRYDENRCGHEGKWWEPR